MTYRDKQDLPKIIAMGLAFCWLIIFLMEHA